MDRHGCPDMCIMCPNWSGRIYHLFQLPVEHKGKTSTYWPLPKESVKVMRNGFRHLKLIIIDEVSMLSSLNLAYIHLRLEELFGGDQWFGGMS